MAKGKAPAARLADWVERWKKILGLTEWYIHIQIEDDECAEEEDSHAITLMRMEWAKNYKSTTLRVFAPVFGLPAHKQEKCIVHELLHLKFVQVDDYLEKMLGLDGAVFGTWRDMMEGPIDGLANRLQETCRSYRT